MAKDIKTGKNTIRVQKSEYKGYEFVDVRKFYEDDEGELRPTKKGIALPLDVADEVADAIKEANKG